MFKNYTFISTQTNLALRLALLSEPKDSPIFGAYPEALVETMQPMPRGLIHSMVNFGFHWIINSFKTDGLPALRIKVWKPQDEVEDNALPSGVTVKDLEEGQFVVEGVEWCVFQNNLHRPYPTTNWGRVDSTFFCAPCSQICD